MIYRNIFVAILLLAFIVSSEHISIKGLVINESGVSIEGAVVQLNTYSQFNTKTNASGEFHLRGDTITPIINTSQNTISSIQISIRGKCITIKRPGQKGRLSVTIVDSKGRTIFEEHKTNTTSFYHTSKIVIPDIAKGLYFIVVKSNKDQFVHKILFTGSNKLSKIVTQQNSSSNSISMAAKRQMAIVDTIVVVAAGYKHKVIDVLSYVQEDLICTLTISNIWTPSGNLIHEGSMVKIMAKDYEFEMGQPNPNIWEIDGSKNEQPVHTVSFTYNYWMDTTLVTQKSYDNVMKTAYTEYKNPGWHTEHGIGDNYPAYLLMWDDAALYCNAISLANNLDTVYTYTAIDGAPGKLCELKDLSFDLSKNGYRLPTEAEWEYACRGGTGTDYFWGKNYEPYPENTQDTMEINSYAAWANNALNMGKSKPGYGTHTVTDKKPNPYGLYDMSGNLSQWCNDWWNNEGYTWEDAIDPTGQKVGSNKYHFIRGSNWGNEVSFLRSANRRFLPADYQYYFLGFRTVKPVL